MKKIMTIILNISVLTLLITSTTISAAEKVNVVELAESGITISFPVSAEDIATDSVTSARLNASRETIVARPAERLEIFEMAESGQTITFPLGAEDIARMDAETAKSDISTMDKAKPFSPVVTFELSESGEVIEFSAPAIEAVADYADECYRYC